MKDHEYRMIEYQQQSDFHQLAYHRMFVMLLLELNAPEPVVATSIEECERRDRKGLYKLAREGKIKEFTGISDPYDVPENPELSLDTETVDVDYCAQQVLLKLEQMGLVAG